MCKIKGSSFKVNGIPLVVVHKDGSLTFLPKHEEEEVWISSDDVTEKTLLSEVDVVSRRKLKILKRVEIKTVGDLFSMRADYINQVTGIGEAIVRFWRRQIIEKKGYKPPFWIKV